MCHFPGDIDDSDVSTKSHKIGSCDAPSRARVIATHRVIPTEAGGH